MVCLDVLLALLQFQLHPVPKDLHLLEAQIGIIVCIQLIEFVLQQGGCVTNEITPLGDQ